MTVGTSHWCTVVGCFAVLALFGCGGKSSANAGATRGVGGLDAGAGGLGGGTGSDPSCNVEGSTRLIGGVRHRCKAGVWVPVSECMMGADTCCFEATPMKSASIASDPCLVPYPSVTADGAEACTNTADSCGWCVGIEGPVPRTAALDAAGKCVAVDECETAADCVIAVNHLQCCACPEPFPKRMLEQEPCITDPTASPAPGCSDCSAVDCVPCEPPVDPEVLCVPNYAGIRSCVFPYSFCQAQAVKPVPEDQDPPLPNGCLVTPYRWDGRVCLPFPGCQCSGPGCSELTDSAESCLRTYQVCGAVCVPGMDQTCNDSPIMNGLAGHCEADGTCTCSAGHTFVSTSGRCL